MERKKNGHSGLPRKNSGFSERGMLWVCAHNWQREGEEQFASWRTKKSLRQTSWTSSRWQKSPPKRLRRKTKKSLQPPGYQRNDNGWSMSSMKLPKWFQRGWDTPKSLWGRISCQKCQELQSARPKINECQFKEDSILLLCGWWKTDSRKETKTSERNSRRLDSSELKEALQKCQDKLNGTRLQWRWRQALIHAKWIEPRNRCSTKMV